MCRLNGLVAAISIATGNCLKKFKKECKRIESSYGNHGRQASELFWDCPTVDAMSSALLASLFHAASSSQRKLHTYCEKGSSSWCQYQRDVSNGINLYKPGSGLPDSVIAHAKPIYHDLGDHKNPGL